MTLDQARRLLGLSGDEDAATVERAYRRAIERRTAQGNTDGVRQVEEAYAVVRDAGEHAPIDAVRRPKQQAPWENWYAWVLVFMAILAARAVVGIVRGTLFWEQTQEPAETTELAPAVETEAPSNIEPAAPVDPVENFARLAENAGEAALARRVRDLANELKTHCDEARRSLEDVEERTHATELSWLVIALDPVRTEYDRACGVDE